MADETIVRTRLGARLRLGAQTLDNWIDVDGDVTADSEAHEAIRTAFAEKFTTDLGVPIDRNDERMKLIVIGFPSHALVENW